MYQEVRVAISMVTDASRPQAMGGKGWIPPSPPSLCPDLRKRKRPESGSTWKDLNPFPNTGHKVDFGNIGWVRLCGRVGIFICTSVWPRVSQIYGILPHFYCVGLREPTATINLNSPRWHNGVGVSSRQSVLMEGICERLANNCFWDGGLCCQISKQNFRKMQSEHIREVQILTCFII